MVGVLGTRSGGAFVYRGGQILDLNAVIDPTLGLALTEARAINDRGQIVADTYYIEGSGSRTYLLTPVPDATVPEPGTLAACAAALLLLCGGRLTRR